MEHKINEEYRKPHIDAVKSWRLARIIGLAVTFTIVCCIVAAVYLFTDSRMIFISASAAGLLLVIYKIAGLFIYPVLEYRQWKYMISAEKVEIIQGIFFINRDIIPVVRMQNITIKQGPIDRKFGLFTVEIALASGTFDIAGLKEETAQEVAQLLRSRLYERLGENCRDREDVV